MSAKNFTPLDKPVSKLVSPPVSLPKETEPTPIKDIEIKEVVEHELEKELHPYIQKRSETIKLPPDLKKIGLQSSSTTQFPSYQSVKIPISDDRVIFGLNAPITSSLRWLATLALYILKQAHLSLKVVHGHVVRILKK